MISIDILNFMHKIIDLHDGYSTIWLGLKQGSYPQMMWITVCIGCGDPCG